MGCKVTALARCGMVEFGRPNFFQEILSPISILSWSLRRVHQPWDYGQYWLYLQARYDLYFRHWVTTFITNLPTSSMSSMPFSSSLSSALQAPLTPHPRLTSQVCLSWPRHICEPSRVSKRIQNRSKTIRNDRPLGQR